MSNAHPLPTESQTEETPLSRWLKSRPTVSELEARLSDPDPLGLDDSIPASRLMQERNELRAEVSEARAEIDELRSELEALRAENAAEYVARGADQQQIRNLLHERDAARELARYHKKRDEAQVEIIQRERAFHFRQLAEMRAEIAEAKRAWSPDRVEVADLREKIARLETAVRKLSGESADYRSQLCEILAGDAGEDCPECHGYGGTGSRSGDSWDDCDAGCFDGRVSREALR